MRIVEQNWRIVSSLFPEDRQQMAGSQARSSDYAGFSRLTRVGELSWRLNSWQKMIRIGRDISPAGYLLSARGAMLSVA
jgi:hypothetical protein